MAAQPKLEDIEAELQRRGITTSSASVLDKKGTSLEEFKKFAESSLKGSAKGIIDIVGGWGNLYDYLKESKNPNAFSSAGITQAVKDMTGVNIMSIPGYEGAYKFGQAGAPQALFGRLASGNLINLSTPARTAAAEFGVGGSLGLLSQTVAPESPLAQLAMQSLPYLVKGGVQGLKEKSVQRKIEEYRSLLPDQDKNVFDQFILKGQGSTDPQVVNDILRLTNSTRYGELVASLNAGASEKALAGMAPAKSKLSEQESAIAAAQAIQNKLSGIKEHGADTLFDKARKYGGDTPIVDPTNTIKAIDGLISRYSNAATPNAEKAVQVLQGIREKLAPSFTTPSWEGTTTTVREATPSIQIPGAAQRMETRQRVVTEYDSLGMPHQRTITESYPVAAQPGATIAGTPEVTGVIPGGGGFSVQKGPQPMTVDKVQGFLSEFGRKAGQGDQLIKDLAITDEKVISSAIFGGLHDDLRAAYNAASGADKTALGLLREARTRVANSVEKYNDAIAQGLPAWLKDKSLREINFEEMSAQYNKLTPQQRAYARSLIADTDAEALKALDGAVYNDFVNKARTKNAVGQDVVDLGQLVQNWKNLNPVEKNNLVTALGTNASEFEQRMKYADVFSKRMRLASESEQNMIDNQVIREASAVAGAGGGFQVGKGTQLVLDIANMFGKGSGLTDDQLAKLLLPKEGLDFLKNASLSPRGQKTLESLTNLDSATVPDFVKYGAQVGRAGARMGSAAQPTVEGQNQAIPAVSEPQEPTQDQQLQQINEILKSRGVE